MISTPVTGWSTFSVDEFSFGFSYVENTPLHLIDALTFALELHRPCAVELDGEGISCTLVFNLWDMQTFMDLTIDDAHPNLVVTNHNYDIQTVARRILEDLERDADAWARWMCYDDEDEGHPLDLSRLRTALARYHAGKMPSRRWYMPCLPEVEEEDIDGV